jgi:hypothetical protein
MCVLGASDLMTGFAPDQTPTNRNNNSAGLKIAKISQNGSVTITMNQRAALHCCGKPEYREAIHLMTDTFQSTEVFDSMMAQ